MRPWAWLTRLWRSDDESLVAQLQAWAASDPFIEPLALPPVKPLKAHRAGHRLARFRQRVGPWTAS